MIHGGDMRIANQVADVQREYAPGVRMDRRRDDGRAAMEAPMPDIGRMQINEQRIERPPVRDERAIPRTYRPEMDPPRDERVIHRTYRPEMGPHERYYQGRLYNERDAPHLDVPRRPYNPMDAPQIDRPRREETYHAEDAEARRINQERLLAMNRLAAQLAVQAPPRQQGRNRQGHYGNNHNDPRLIDSDDDLYGDD